ncbi:hypothetical protein IJ732_05570 [bacterium]|nr:hypothetical protein [bacterium]
MEKFTKEYRISLRDMSADFKAKSTTLLHDFEECFAQYCFKNELSGYHLDKIGLMWVIANINLEIFGEMPLWDEWIKFEVWFSEIKKSRAYLEFRAFHKDKLLAHGDSLWFILDQKTRRPVALDKILEPCGIINEVNFDSHKKSDINIEEYNLLNELELDVTFNDLDYNNHVNNVSYVDWAIISIPDEIRKHIKIKKYSLSFLQECFLREKIKTRLYQNGEKLHFEVIKEDGSIACKIDIETERTE